MNDLLKVWNDYYSDADTDTAIKDKHFFSLEVMSIIRQVSEELVHRPRVSLTILELGAGTGYLAKSIVEHVIEGFGIPVSYVGVDFSEVAIAKANRREIQGAKFVASDFFEYLNEDKQHYDIVVTQRSIMAILDRNSQLRLLQVIRQHLKDDGLGIFSEGTQQALDKLNYLRERLGVPPFHRIWHSLHVDQGHIRQVFSSVDVVDFSSTYWLITRVIYPYFQEPQHNTPLHQFAAELPQIGDHGLVKIFLARR